MGDCAACFRVGIIDWEDEWLTGQFTVTTPTGNARQALGVGHSSIDAALLYQRQWSERLTFMAELHDWQTIHLLLARNGKIGEQQCFVFWQKAMQSGSRNG